MLTNKVSKLFKRDSTDDKSSTPRSFTPSGLTTPLRNGALHGLKPYLSAIAAFKHGQDFQAKPSKFRKRAIDDIMKEEGHIGADLTSLYVGISAVFSDTHTAIVAIAIRDSVYLHDFSVKHLDLNNDKDKDQHIIIEHIIKELSSYERSVFGKYIGAGVPLDLVHIAPKLCSRLWSELDIVPVSTRTDDEEHGAGGKNKGYWSIKCVDEQSDSMARKCIMYFGPNQSPLLQVGYRGLVQIDAGFHSHMCTIEDYKTTCGDATWMSVMKFASELKQKKIKIAFFSSTPQGGGVALMRHALVRFARVAGVDLTWYVPKPKPGVFRVTKNVHNTLQGVAKPYDRISADDKKTLTDWIKDNATRYWLSEDGPLRDPSEGGADIIIVDDPQMPGLIPLAKEVSPKRPVLYRSHIQIRSDLIDETGTPQADIWGFLWDNIQHADMFISHPIPSFVPKNVPRSKVAYLPATTDWLDGLNKTLNEWDMRFYIHSYNMQCLPLKMTQLHYPTKKYFIQIARFDPSKGIPDVLKSYTEFHRLLRKKSNDQDRNDIPQLLIVGNGSVDDPDGTLIYDETMAHVETHARQLLPFISVMRLPPNDQLLNTLLSNAHTVLQLSTREGFEVKVSEALHKGKPVICTKAGGIPLQVQDGKNGFLVEMGDWRAVAEKLVDLWTDDGLHQRMSDFAKFSVSDEVSTVGNALSWFYLADMWTGGKGVVPEGRWVNDLAREKAGYPYREGENRLPRGSTRTVG